MNIVYHKCYECYDRIDVSEGIDVNKTSASKSVIFVTIGVSQIIVLSFKF